MTMAVLQSEVQFFVLRSHLKRFLQGNIYMSYENDMIHDLLPIQLIANIYIITCILF